MPYSPDSPEPVKPAITVLEMLTRELAEYAARLDTSSPEVAKAKQTIYTAVAMLKGAVPAVRDASGVCPCPAPAPVAVPAGRWTRFWAWVRTTVLGAVSLALGVLTATQFA